MVIQANRQHKQLEEKDDEVDKDKNSTKSISIDPKTWVKLGHFHLLLEEYDKGTTLYCKYKFM